MDLDAIFVFVKVVDTGSFSAAARLLKMPKTTVSAKVAALEKRLGTGLLHRTTRQLQLTEAGRGYYAHCAKAVHEVELGEAALMSSRDTPSGLLRVTVPVDVGHTLLPRITRAYLDKYLDASVEMILSNRMSDLVGEGIDLAIRAGNLQDSSLVARRFLDLSAHLWATPRHLAEAGVPRHPDELARRPLIGHTSMPALRLANGALEVEVPCAGRAVADDFEAILAMLLLDAGIGLLPDFVAAPAQATGRLVPVLADWTLQSLGGLYFVYPRQKYLSPKVQAFIATALETVGTGPRSDGFQ